MKERLDTFLKKLSIYLQTDVAYIASGSFWIGTGQAILTLTALGLSIIYANFLPSEVLGTYKYVLSVAGILAIATLNGMPTAMTQSSARGMDGGFGEIIKTRIRWGLAGGLASLVLAGYYFFNHNSVLGISFCIVAVFVPFMDSFNIYDSVLSGKKKFRASSLLFSLSQTVTTVSIALAILLTRNIFVITATYFICWTFFRGIYAFKVWKKYTVGAATDPETVPNGKHISLMNIITVIASQLDHVIIFQMIGSAPLAMYSIATAPIDQAKGILGRVFSSLAMPKYAVKEKVDLKKHVFKSTWKLALLVIPAIVIYVLIAPYLFTFLFPKYVAAVGLSQIYAIVLLPSIFFLPQTALYASMARKELYYFNFISSLFQIAFLLAGAYFFGILGVIIARICSSCLNFLLGLTLVKKM